MDLIRQGIFAGTVGIYKGYGKFVKALKGIESVDDFEDLANTMGVGALELAIALSTSNPFLLVGAVLHLTSGIQGLLNEGTVIFFRNYNAYLNVEFSTNALNVNAYLSSCSLENNIKNKSIQDNLARTSLKLY